MAQEAHAAKPWARRTALFAAAFLVISLFGVFAPASTSAAPAKTKALWANGDRADFTVRGSGKAVVRVKASRCQGWPVARIYVDGTFDRAVRVRGTKYRNIATRKSYRNGIHRIRVVMRQDKRVSAKSTKLVVCDRNVWARSAKMRRPAEASTSKAAPKPKDRPEAAEPAPQPEAGKTGSPEAKPTSGERAASRAGATPAAQRTGSVPSGAVYVAPGGSDSASGSAAAPLRSISAAISKTPAGGTIVLRGGQYHESVVLSKRLTLMAHPGEQVWLDGSSARTDWTKTGATWSIPHAVRFDASPSFTRGGADGTTADWTFVNQSYPMAAHPDQVFVDGAKLREVESLAKVGAGTFYVDDAAGRLHIGVDPSSRSVRVSDLQKAIAVRAAGAKLDGFGVRRYAPSLPDLGAVTMEKDGASATDLLIEDNASIGIGVFNEPNMSLRRITARGNGLMGIMGNGAYNLTVDAVRVEGNNAERFNSAPAAGGFKITRSRNLTVTNSVFSGNHATGLWFDQSCYNATIVGNDIVGNATHGLFYELSSTAVIADNVVLNNGANGLKINNSDKLEIWNNSVVGNGNRQVNLVQDARRAANLTGSDYDPKRPKPDPTVPWLLKDISVHNNVVGQGAAGGGNCLMCVEDYSKQVAADAMNLSLRANLYNRPKGSPNWLAVWSKGAGDPAVYTQLSQFRSATGQESGSASVDGSSVESGAVLKQDLAVAVSPVALTSSLRSLLGWTSAWLGAWLV